MFDGVSSCGITASIGAASSSPSEGGSQIKKGQNLKVKFSDEEDQKLKDLVTQHGTKDWILISKLMETRNPRQCRERWNNYINPALRVDPWTPEEDMILDAKFSEYGPRWNKIAKFFVNRSDNNIRNRWMMIARHRTKHTKNIIPTVQTHRKEMPAIVMPVVKETRAVEKRQPENSFELLSVPQIAIGSISGDVEQFDDFWGDFSFF